MLWDSSTIVLTNESITVGGPLTRRFEGLGYLARRITPHCLTPPRAHWHLGGVDLSPRLPF